MHTNKTAVSVRPFSQQVRRSIAGKAFWMYLLLYTAGGFLAASATAFGTLAPFGVAFAAAVKPKYSGAAICGAVGGYLVASPSGALKYVIALALLIFGRWALHACGIDYTKRAVCLATTAVVLLIPTLALTFVLGGSVYDGMLAASESLLGCCVAYFFSRSVDATSLGLGNLQQIDISSIIITFCIATLGLTGFHIWGLSVGRILAATVILLAASVFHEAGGAIAGVAGGLSAGLLGGQAFFMGTYGFGGLLAGVFAPLGRLASAGAFVIVHLFTLLASRRTDIHLLMLEILIGAAISMLPSNERLGRIKLYGRENDVVRGEAYRSMLGGHIGQMSGALRRVADTTRKVNERLSSMQTDDPASVFESAAAKVCQRCKLNMICWQERYNDTSRAMNDLLGALRQDGEIVPTQFPDWFSQICPKTTELASEINSAFSAYTARESLRRRSSRVRGVVTDQFESMAQMIDAMGQEIGELTAQDARAQGRVREYLHKQKVFPDDIICTVDQAENMRLAVTIPQYKLSRVDEAELTIALSELCEREFDLPLHRDAPDARVTLTFSEKAVFSVRWHAAQIGSGGSRLCGDSYSYVDGRGGRANVILSDGMGSGGAAAVDSTMTAQLLKSLIEAGIGLEAGLGLVNSALLVRTGEESLATIDITGIDLYTGKITFYKAGAAPTFICKNGKSGYVESRSMPAGILSGVGFEKSAVMMRDGDWIVMVSDGVVSSGYDWILSDLEHYEGEDPDELCEKLAQEAKRRRSDGHEDDITVIAIRLTKGI